MASFGSNSSGRFLTGDGAQLCKNGHLGGHGKQPPPKIDKPCTLLWNVYKYI
jgi:hypothetical protein